MSYEDAPSETPLHTHWYPTRADIAFSAAYRLRNSPANRLSQNVYALGDPPYGILLHFNVRVCIWWIADTSEFYRPSVLKLQRASRHERLGVSMIHSRRMKIPPRTSVWVTRRPARHSWHFPCGLYAETGLEGIWPILDGPVCQFFKDGECPRIH